MKLQPNKNKSRKLYLPALVLGALIISAFLTVQSTKQKQEIRSRAAGAEIPWGTAQALPGESGTTYYRAIAASGSTVHVARGEGTIYYRRSTNEGTNWSNEVAIGTGTLYLEDPLIVEGSNVYIVYVRNTRPLTDWCCARNVGDIFFKVSRDNGISWEPERQLTTTRGAYRVSLAAAGTNVYAVWMDFRSQNTWDLYYRRSVNSGSSWEPEMKLVAGANATGAGRPQIAAIGNSVHITWLDGRDNKPSCVIEGTYTLPQCTEVYYKRSTDGGINWGDNIRLTQGTAYSGRPEIAAGSNGAVVVSYDNAYDSTGLETFTVHSVDNGFSWSGPIRLSFASGDSTHSSLIFNGSTFHIVWFDRRGDSTAGIYYRNSSDNGASWGSQEQVGLMSGSLAAPLLAGTTNYVHAIWGNMSQQTIYNRRTLTVPTNNPSSPQATQTPSIVPTYSCLGFCATPIISRSPTRTPTISLIPTGIPTHSPIDGPFTYHPTHVPTPTPPVQHGVTWWNHLLDFFSRMFKGQHK